MTPACAHPQGARTSHSLCRPSPKSAGSPSIRQWKRTSQLTWKRSSQQHAYSIFAPKRLASSLVGRSPQRPMYVGATLPCVANIEAISGVIATYTFSSWRAFMLYEHRVLLILELLRQKLRRNRYRTCIEQQPCSVITSSSQNFWFWTLPPTNATSRRRTQPANQRISNSAVKIA